MFKKCLLLILILVSANSYGEAFSYENGLTLKDVYVGYEDGNLFFSVDRDLVNPNSCTAGGNRLVGFDSSRGNIDHVLSVLLYAHAAGKKVHIQIYNSSCASNHRSIRRVKVSN